MLFKHQQEFLKQNIDKTTLVWSCGTGKSLAAVEWSLLHPGPALVICPKALKNQWHREFYKREVKPYKYSIITKEEFRKMMKSGKAHLFDDIEQVIVDEVHNGFLTPLFKSQMSDMLRKFLKTNNIERVLLLSATVYTSSPWNIFNLAYFTGYNWNWYKFKQEFFYDIRMGNRIIPQVKKGSEEKLAQLTKRIASVVDIHDCMDVPLQYHAEPEYFTLTVAQQRAIKDNYDPLPIVRYTAQHEIENGILLGNEFRKPQTYETDKEERIIELCKENKKVAIICRYNAQIDYYQGILEFYKPFVIRGDVQNRDEVTRIVEEKKEAIVLIQADCAEGYQLPSFGLCIFASMSYSYTKWEQICGRFLRMDKPSRTTFLYLLTEGDSIDQAVYDSVKKKEDFKIALYEKRS